MHISVRCSGSLRSSFLNNLILSKDCLRLFPNLLSSLKKNLGKIVWAFFLSFLSLSRDTIQSSETLSFRGLKEDVYLPFFYQPLT